MQQLHFEYPSLAAGSISFLLCTASISFGDEALQTFIITLTITRTSTYQCKHASPKDQRCGQNPLKNTAITTHAKHNNNISKLCITEKQTAVRPQYCVANTITLEPIKELLEK